MGHNHETVWDANSGRGVHSACLSGGTDGCGVVIPSWWQVAGDTRNFIPPGSYLDEFVQAADSALNEVGEDVFVYMDLEGTNLHDEALLQRMQKIADAVRANEWVSDCSVSDLPGMMLLLHATAPDADTFYSDLVC